MLWRWLDSKLIKRETVGLAWWPSNLGKLWHGHPVMILKSLELEYRVQHYWSGLAVLLVSGDLVSAFMCSCWWTQGYARTTKDQDVVSKTAFCSEAWHWHCVVPTTMSPFSVLKTNSHSNIDLDFISRSYWSGSSCNVSIIVRSLNIINY